MGPTCPCRTQIGPMWGPLCVLAGIIPSFLPSFLFFNPCSLPSFLPSFLLFSFLSSYFRPSF